MNKGCTFKKRLSLFVTRCITTNEEIGEDKKDLVGLCERIELCFGSSEARILKNDHASTVVKVGSGEEAYVIKRDNPVNFPKYVKRLFKKSRSFRIWHKDKFLKSMALDTLTPLALVEDYAGFVRKKSFVVSAFIEGPTLDRFLLDPVVSMKEREAMALKCLQALWKWHEKGISHQDPKAKNIIIKDGTIFFIDTEDISVPRLRFLKKREFSRDMVVMLFNFRNHGEIKASLIRNICRRYEFGLNYLAKRIINKFRKTQFPEFLERLNEKTAQTPDMEPFLRGSAPADWERRDSGKCHDLFVNNNNACILLMAGPFFPFYQRLGRFSGKKARPRGILWVTFCLRVCGFVLPEIAGGGIINGKEYLLYRFCRHKRPLKEFWGCRENEDEAGAGPAAFGRELGRFHAMGFANRHLSLDDIYVMETGRGYEITFPVSPFNRWHSGGPFRSFEKQVRALQDEIASLLSRDHAACFYKAHGEMVRRK